MRTLHTALVAIAVTFLITVISAEPKVTAGVLEKQVSRFPLVGHGTAFLDRGREFGVDPRLIVAIAGAETTYGRNLCGTFNAWNWFWGGTCGASPFDSFQSGIRTVSKFMVKSYLRKGFKTIPQVGGKYCAEGCEHWVPLVTKFYTEMGGNVTNLSYSEAPVAPVDPKTPEKTTPVTPDKGADTKTDTKTEKKSEETASGDSALLVYGLPILIGLVLIVVGIGIGLALRRPSRASH